MPKMGVVSQQVSIGLDVDSNDVLVVGGKIHLSLVADFSVLHDYIICLH